MAKIKSYQTGKYGAVSQKLLNEIAAAKVCLLKPEKKADYDRRLGEAEQKAAVKEKPPLQERSGPIAAHPGQAVTAPAQYDAGLSFLEK